MAVNTAQVLDHANERCDDSPAVGGGPFVDTHDGPLSFEAFFGESYSRLARALYLLVHDRAEAEDLAQEAFARVYERWDQVGVMESPTGYLFRVGLNLHRKRLRRLAVAAKHAVRGDDHVPDPAEAIADHRGVLDGLATLPDGQRRRRAGGLPGARLRGGRRGARHRGGVGAGACASGEGGAPGPVGGARRCLKTCGRPSSVSDRPCRSTDGSTARCGGRGDGRSRGGSPRGPGRGRDDRTPRLAAAARRREVGSAGQAVAASRPSVHKHLRAGRRVRTVSSATRWPTPTGGSRRSRAWPDGRIEGVPEMACHFFDPETVLGPAVRGVGPSRPGRHRPSSRPRGGRARDAGSRRLVPRPTCAASAAGSGGPSSMRTPSRSGAPSGPVRVSGARDVGSLHRRSRRARLAGALGRPAGTGRPRRGREVPTGVRGRADDARDAHRALRTDHSASEGLRPVDVDHRWA